MDAYHAYYNNNEEKKLATENETNIINNIMHINHSGANINITTGGNCHNNFIFNHTTPINLNFYKDAEGNDIVPKENKTTDIQS
jgi:hypothetical protein